MLVIVHFKNCLTSHLYSRTSDINVCKTVLLSVLSGSQIFFT